MGTKEEMNAAIQKELDAPETDSTEAEPAKAEPEKVEEETGDASPPETKEEESSEEPGGEEQPDDSVQSVVDAKLRTALEASTAKLGRPGEVGPKGAYDQLFNNLLTQLKGELTGKKAAPSGVMDISEVNINDPKEVQKYLDTRITHFLTEAIRPIQQNAALRDADLELTKLSKDHPDAWKYGKAMAKLIEEHPQLPLEYAYRIASSDARVSEGKEAAYKSMDKKKAANLAKSTVKPPAEVVGKQPKSKREAILMALDETGASFDS